MKNKTLAVVVTILIPLLGFMGQKIYANHEGSIARDEVVETKVETGDEKVRLEVKQDIKELRVEITTQFSEVRMEQRVMREAQNTQSQNILVAIAEIKAKLEK